jgi:hypothetical protein
MASLIPGRASGGSALPSIRKAALAIALLASGACAGERASSRNAPAAAAHGGGLAPRQARSLPLTAPVGLGLDAAGNTYLAGTLFSNAPVDFAGRTVKPLGDGNLLLASLDPRGNVRWLEAIGDANPDNVASAAGTAVTQDGRMAVIGRFSGQLTFGVATVESAKDVDLVAAVDASSGARLWARKLDEGSNGSILAIAANPRSPSNRIAVCGTASAAAKDLVPGATFGGGIHDLVIGVFDSAGNRLWSAQIGGPGYESCTALAMDDAGDVYAAGQFDGASITFPGPTPVTLTGPGSAARKAIWIAKFRGAGEGGAASTLAAVAFQGAAGLARPNALALDPAGALLVAGYFSSSLSFTGAPCSAGADPAPAGCLLGAGSTDAFVAKLQPSAGFTAAWAVRLGGTGRDEAYGVAAGGRDVVAVGRVSTSPPSFRSANGGKDTTGAARLGTSGTGNPDAFLLRLDGETGATRFAGAYGDGRVQQADAVAASGAGATAQVVVTGTLGGSATFGSAGTVTSAGAGVGAFLLFAGLE